MTTSTLLENFKQKQIQAQQEFVQKHSLAKKWFDQRQFSLAQIRKHSARLLTGATLSGAILLASPQLRLLYTSPHSLSKPFITLTELLNRLQKLSQPGLTSELMVDIESSIKNFYGIRAVFELDKQHLPTYLGMMGLEQHLIRFPDDAINQHQQYPDVGMAPFRSAFGYFTQSDKPFSQTEQEEMYYIVLQTFIIPDWEKDWVRLKEWYKLRKFLVINTQNGKAVVAALGDAGPAVWTGKQFGGSPEVMAALGFYPAKTRGEVVVLYLDDPANEIPLGPISTENI